MTLLQYVTILVSIKIVVELKKIGIESDFAANKLKQGSGEPVCSALYKLGQKVLETMKIHLVKPQFPSDSREGEEENKDDGDKDNKEPDVIEDMGKDMIDEEDDLVNEVSPSPGKGVKDEQNEENAEIIVSKINPEEWMRKS